MNRPPAPERPAPAAPRRRAPVMPQRTAPPPRAPEPVEDHAPPPRSFDRRALRAAGRDRRRALAAELRPRARRRRRIVPLAVAGVLALLIGLPLVLAFAPVFTVRSVEVPGASAAVARQVQAALAGERGTPLADVADDRVAAALQAVPAVQSFTVVRRPPSTLEVRVVLRTAVAQQRVGTQWQQRDAAGVVMSSTDAQDPALPVVSIGEVRPARSYAAAVSALEAVQQRGLLVSDVVAAGPDDVLMTLPGGRRVRWGGPEDGAEKAEALQAALVRAGRDVDEIDVSSPGVVLTR